MFLRSEENDPTYLERETVWFTNSIIYQCWIGTEIADCYQTIHNIGLLDATFVHYFALEIGFCV